MPQINQLSAATSVNLGDLFVLFSTNNGDARKLAASVLLDFIQSNIGQGSYVTQRTVVASTGFNVQVTDNGGNIWLILQPTATFASGAITLPPVANVIDGQEVLVFCTRQVTSFSVDGNGAVDVLGEPSTLTAESFFTLRFDAGSSTWYRIS